MIEEVTIEGGMIAEGMIVEGDLPEITTVTEIGTKVAMKEAITVVAAATITVEEVASAAPLKETITVVAVSAAITAGVAAAIITVAAVAV